MIEESVPSLSIQPCYTSTAFEKALLTIPCVDVLHQLPTGYVYLKVSENFMDELLPCINVPATQSLAIERRVDDVGAHVSIIYPDEIEPDFDVPDFGKTMDFKILGLYTASVYERTYKVLVVQSVALEKIRIALHLGKKPLYHGAEAPFHITLARVIDVATE